MVSEEKIQEMAERLSLLERQIQSLTGRKKAELSDNDVKTLEAEINRLLFVMGWINNPQFFLSGMPTGPFDLPELFESQSASIVQLFESPPVVRQDGFGFYSADFRSKIVDGIAREAIFTSQARRITRDGKFTVLYSGGDEFLGWGMRSSGWGVSEANKQTPLRINSLVLIEATFNFVKFVKEVVNQGTPSSQDVLYLLGYTHMKSNGSGPLLLDGKADRSMAIRQQIPSDADSCRIKIIADQAESAGRTTFRLVSEVYHLFNLTDNRIPYTVRKTSDYEIDPSQF